MSPFRQPLLVLSRSDAVKGMVTRLPFAGDIVARFVPGETREDVVRAVSRLAEDGLYATVDHLGEDTTDPEQADLAVDEYAALLEAFAARGLSDRVEVSIKLTAIGLDLPGGRRLALDNARRICRAARNAGTTVTLDMEDHTVTDVTLEVLRELRQDFPETGVAVQAYLYRTEVDARALARSETRVRLCKGAYDEPEEVAHTARGDVDRAYVRCLKTLLAGKGYPMIATHDPRLIEIASALVSRYGRAPGTYADALRLPPRGAEAARCAR